MGKIIYLVGRSVDARQRLLAEKMDSREFHSILHIVPTKGRVMELEADPNFWLKRRANTLTGVIYQIFQEDIRHKQFKDCNPIDETLQSLLVKKALSTRVALPDGLIYFNRILKDHNREYNFPGIYGAIASFFSQLVRNNYQDIFA